MYKQLFALLLVGACAAAANAQDCGYGVYGSYGTFGGYGAFGTPRFCRPPGIGYPGYYPYAGVGSAGIGVAEAPHDDGRKELEKTLQAYENKLRALEKRFEEQDKLAENQANLIKAMDRKHQESQDKLLVILQGTSGGGNMNDELAKLSAAMSELLAATKNSPTNTALAVLHTRIETLEKQLGQVSVNNLPDQVKKMLDEGYANWKASLKTGSGTQMGLTPNQGLIVVNLPADAKLFLNDYPSAVGQSVRSFLSPVLEPGKNYFYTLRIEMERGGKTLTETQRVYFQPGREVRVSFDHLEAPAVVSAPQNK